MTREEAITKVKKIIARANGTDNINEREVAKTQAAKLMTEHNIKAEDIAVDEDSALYDKIAQTVKDFTSKHPPINLGIFSGFNVIGEIIDKTADSVSPANKAKVVKMLREKRNLTIASMLLGSSFDPLLKEITTILSTTNPKERTP